MSQVTLRLGSYTLRQGEGIKITRTPGQAGVTLINSMGVEAIRHFRVGPEDADVIGTDAAGNFIVTHVRRAAGIGVSRVCCRHAARRG